MKSRLFIISFFSAGLASSAQWVDIDTPYAGNHNAIAFNNDGVGIIACNTTVLRSTDSGASWQTLTGVYPSGLAMDVDFVTDNDVYWAGTNDEIGVSDDAGLTWDTQAPGADPFGYYTLAFTSPTTGYAGGTAGTLMKTINAGASWSALNANVSLNDIEDIEFITPDIGLLCGEGGKIKRTTNAGASWGTVSSGTTGRIKDIEFLNASVGFVVGQNGYMRKTVDGGVSFTNVTTNITSALTTICFKDDMIGLAAGYGPTVLVTTDGGTTWSQESTGLFSGITVEEITYYNGNFFMVTTQGHIMTRSGVVTVPEIKSEPDFTLFPNPARLGSAVSIICDNPGNSSITIIDMAGRTVYCNGLIGKVQLELPDLVSGIYLVTIKQEHGVSIIRRLEIL